MEAREEPGTRSVIRRTPMTQAMGNNTVQSTSVSRSTGVGPNLETPSRTLQIPEASAENPSTGVAEAGRSSKCDPALGETDSDDKGEGENPRRERGGHTLSGATEPRQAGARQAEAEQAGTGRSRGGECLESATPRRQMPRSLTPPTSNLLVSDSPARSDSETAAEFLQMGARPKLSQILQMYPELESMLRTPSPQKPAVEMPSSPRRGTAKPQTRRASITPSKASSSSELPTLRHFFPVSYKKSTSSEQQFKQKPREPLPIVRDDKAVKEDQGMSITDDDIIRITASEGIPVWKTKALEFSQQASSFLLSKEFMKQKSAAKKFDDAQQSLAPVLREKEKEKEKKKETKQDEVQPQKQVDPRKDEAAAKQQTQQSIPVSDKTQASATPEFLATDWTYIRKYALKKETLPISSKGMAMPVTYDAQDVNPR
ncbi:hypothetical protein DUI87_05814 [Hirundo rustica rustica]|uniref:Uncharacterized protein n=1 Tax=Hirundo rustica rustica TaxID=333673 RepID=A0A3M0KWP8_HIRRU|nr:hypothetical protein DUI87_05814 [Hirundo rustica rustica]